LQGCAMQEHHEEQKQLRRFPFLDCEPCDSFRLVDCAIIAGGTDIINS
jgi:hypothetical protein